MGLGIVGMHYTGMAAMRMPASVQYSRLLVALSVVVAIGAAIVALWLAGRQHDFPRKAIAAIAMGLAISGMHYTGMAAATFTGVAATGPALNHASLEQTQLALAISGATILLLCLALAGAFYDRRIAQLVEREVTAVRRAEHQFSILLHGVKDYAIYLIDPTGICRKLECGSAAHQGLHRR